MHSFYHEQNVLYFKTEKIDKNSSYWGTLIIRKLIVVQPIERSVLPSAQK